MFLLSLVVTLLVGIISLSIYLFYHHKYGYWKRRGVPGPKPCFPYGNFRSMFTRHVSDPMEKLYNEYKHLSYFGIYSLWYPVLIVRNPELIKSVLIKDSSYFNARGWYVNEKVEPMSAHLFSLAGQSWKDMRTKFSPAFTSGKTKMMYANMIQVANKFEKYLCDQKKIKDIFDFRYENSLFTSENISNTVFGLETKTFENGYSKIAEYAHKMLMPVNFIERTMVTLMIMAPKLLHKFNFRLWDDSLTNFFVSLIDTTIKSREKTGTERNDFVQFLIQMKNNNFTDEQGNIINQKGSQLTSEQMAAQAFIFFQAGYDSSSGASSFALYELASRQAIQDKVRQEILETLERYGGECTYDAVMEMKYLYAVLEETLRMHPPLNYVYRQITENYVIPNTNIVIEEGTQVLIPNLNIQMDSTYFENPEQFIPKRFLPENKGKIVPCTYLSFGDGPRICIGLKFGMIQAALAVITVLKNYKVTTCKKTDIPVKRGGSPIVIEPLSIYLKLTEV